MGVAQYNRGTKAIQFDIDRSKRPVEFAFMDDLNAVPKTANAYRPFGDVHFVPGRRGWWAECPVTGYGFWFRALRTAVAAFRVEVYARKGDAWIARPAECCE